MSLREKNKPYINSAVYDISGFYIEIDVAGMWQLLTEKQELLPRVNFKNNTA